MKTAQRRQIQGHLAGIGCLFLANATVIVLLALISTQLDAWSLHTPAFLCILALNGIGFTQLLYVPLIRRWLGKKGYRQVARGVTGGAELTLVLTIVLLLYILSGVWI